MMVEESVTRLMPPTDGRQAFPYRDSRSLTSRQYRAITTFITRLSHAGVRDSDGDEDNDMHVDGTRRCFRYTREKYNFPNSDLFLPRSDNECVDSMVTVR